MRAFETIRHDKPTKIEGILVEIDEPEFIRDFPCFAYEDANGWYVVEAASGMSISSNSKTLKGAKARATSSLFKHGKGLFLDLRKKAIWDHGGLNLDVTGLSKGQVNP